MKHLTLILSLFFSIIALQAQPETTKKHRIIFQMSSGDIEAQNGLINNLESLKNGWGDDVEIEVVAHGPGISMVVEDMSAANSGVLKMIKRGVIFVACENTMAKKKISREQLLKGVGTVPMGIGEIVLKQEQGWTYIKGGF